MIRTILIVDDDKIWLRLVQKKFDKYKEAFSVIVAKDGLDAVEKLKQHAVSLVVTDMQMPRMDGLSLLAHMSAHYPDVHVIVVTAYSTPKLKKAVLERGGAGYIEKPFVVEELAKKITQILKKESEGGVLQTVPLEMFIQLIEMEQKTSTIRVFNKVSGKKGVLFFREGELMDARLPGVDGKQAAYEIFSWDEVAMAIQDECAIEQKKIDEDLQAILLDAMRLKDESSGSEGFDEEADLLETEELVKPEDAAEEVEDLDLFGDASPPPKTRSADADIGQLLKDETGILDVRRDETHRPMMEVAVEVGKLIDAGTLKVCFLSKGEQKDTIIVPGRKMTAISVDLSASRDRIIDLLRQI